MARKKVEVELRLPMVMIDWVDQQVKIGILGETRDQVITHLLRDYLFRIEQSKPAIPDE